MTHTAKATLRQDHLRPATLAQTVALLSDPARLGARLCSEVWSGGHHNGTCIRWPGEAARYTTDRERARLRLRLEELGLRVSSRLLDEALLLAPAAPEDVSALAFLTGQGGAAS